MEDDGFTLAGSRMPAPEIIARLWSFIHSLPEDDRANGRASFLSALADCFEQGARVCNQGKAQRLCQAVLVGRLFGVNIDRPAERNLQGMREAFWHRRTEEGLSYREIRNAEELRAVAVRFLREESEPPVAEEEDLYQLFMREIDEYIAVSDF
jgi:hypothetical protein